MIFLWILIALVALVILVPLVFILVSFILDRPKHADVMLVLGTDPESPDGVAYPGCTLYYRLERARTLFEQGYAPRIIVSGSKCGRETISEALSMYNYLTAHGVPRNAVIIEDNSHTTRENMTCSKPIMDKRGYKTALVVTSRFHLWRSKRLTKRFGIDASFAGARNSDTLLHCLQKVLRELMVIYMITTHKHPPKKRGK